MSLGENPSEGYPVAMRIGIVGTGRFGSFWATSLSKHATVLTFNRSDRPTPEGCNAASLSEVGSCDAIMLCVAISAIGEATRELAPHLTDDAVLMDTCSVKVDPARAMVAHAPPHTEIIATHPMFGPDSAGAGISGHPFVFSPVRASERTSSHWQLFFAELGLDVIRMTPDEHDREAAFTQGITHFLGRVLADMDLHPSPIATVGYQKLLEVMQQTCNDPFQLFVDLQQLNEHTGEMRERLQTSLGRLMELLGGSTTDRGPSAVDSSESGS